jgi:hypothetical protein
MKVTMSTLFNAHPAFQILANQFYYLDKIESVWSLVDEVNIHYKNIAAKQEELLQFYGKKLEDCKYDVDDEKKSFYERELDEFLATEIELTWEPVPVESLGKFSLPLPAYELLKFLFAPKD